MSEPDTTMTIPLRAVINRIVGGGTPSRAVDAYWGGDISWASVKDFSDSRSVIHDTQEHITEKGLSNSAANLIEPKTILICTRMAVGRAAICTRHIAINQDVKALYLSEELEAEYLLLLLKQHRPFLESMAIGSTVKGLSIDQLLDLRVSIPSKTEQTRIAAILSCIDRAIEQTEALIAKQQRIKTGLMQDLLTKGIDEHGNIRSEATHEFKDSPLGRIPKEWRIVSVVDVPPVNRATIQTGPFGAQLSPKEFQPSGVPVLKIGNVQAGFLNLKELDFVAENKAQSLNRFRIATGDLLFARQGATTGRNALAHDECDGWLINYHIIRVAVNHELCLPHYLEFCFNSHYVQYQVALSKGRSNRDGINSSDIAAIKFPLPSFDEQQQIVTTILSLRNNIEINKRSLTQYHAIKQGLMQDLLTGKVSVRNLLSEPEAAVA